MSEHVTRCTEQGLTCDYCGENVNVHCCSVCGARFWDGESIVCDGGSSACDASHRHTKCEADP